jgi:hypothetical protein
MIRIVEIRRHLDEGRGAGIRAGTFMNRRKFVTLPEPITIGICY